jgi:hypothetical protein
MGTIAQPMFLANHPKPPGHGRTGGYDVVMFVVDLVCADGHLFEGWYDNRDAFAEAREAGLTCPVCQGTDVDLRPNFRGVLTRSSSTSPTTTASSTTATTTVPPPLPLEVQKALSALIKHIRAHTEDAGDAFAARALAMHKGDEAPAPIHGTSTPEEREQLRDEGVPFVALPVPEIDEN